MLVVYWLVCENYMIFIGYFQYVEIIGFEVFYVGSMGFVDIVGGVDLVVYCNYCVQVVCLCVGVYMCCVEQIVWFVEIWVGGIVLCIDQYYWFVVGQGQVKELCGFFQCIFVVGDDYVVYFWVFQCGCGCLLQCDLVWWIYIVGWYVEQIDDFQLCDGVDVGYGGQQLIV